MDRTRHSLTKGLVFLALLGLLALAPFAQGDEPPPSPVAGTQTADKYSPEELEQIVGPIALYPDIVLSSVLPASAVPTDVVQAARWVQKQSGEISAPPADSGWDPSVEAMVQFPDVLVWMSENLDWMEMLAYAVAVQQGDVLQAVQDFRAKTKDAGNLESNDKIQVVVESNDVIYVQPASPSVVYVPTYDPVAVIRPGYVWGSGFWAGFAAGATGAWAWHNLSWGHHGNYGSINVNRSPQFNFTNNGVINTGNIGSGNRWNSPNRPNRPPARTPAQTRPAAPKWNQGAGSRPRPGGEGVRPGASTPDRPRPRPGARPGETPSRPGAGGPPSRPGGGEPPSRPGAGGPPSRPGGGEPPSRPGAGGPPSRPGGSPGATRPSTPPGRPSTQPAGRPERPSASPGTRDVTSGSSRNGRSTKQASDRGRGSMSGSRSGGASRGGGGGGGRGGRR